jgi:hypothetical protein
MRKPQTAASSPSPLRHEPLTDHCRVTGGEQVGERRVTPLLHGDALLAQGMGEEIWIMPSQCSLLLDFVFQTGQAGSIPAVVRSFLFI